MKTTLWFILFILFLCTSLQAQERNKKILDSRFDKEILIGYCDREGLQDGEFGESYAYEYNEYIPNSKFIRKIRKQKHKYIIVLVLATWCDDSKEQVPRFYRILDEAGIPEDIMNVICVDGQKTAEEISLENYNIERVPTFIFYRNGKEIGRIIETPEASLEEDMLNIINRALGAGH